MDEVIDLSGGDAKPDDDVVELREDGAPTLPRRATRNSDGTVTLQLSDPVSLKFRKNGEVQEETFAELHMRRMTGADLIAVQSAEADQRAIMIISRSAGIPLGKMRPVFERMDAADAGAAMQVVGYFLESGQTTGR